MARFHVDCYCAETHRKMYGHPENSYGFETEAEVIKCLTDLVNNSNSGIYRTELTINDFAEKEDEGSGVSVEFTCVCGKQKGWISDGQITKPCPSCGRVYKGKEEVNKIGITEILAIELEKERQVV